MYNAAPPHLSSKKRTRMGKSQSGLIKNISGLNVIVARWWNMHVRISGRFPMLCQLGASIWYGRTASCVSYGMGLPELQFDGFEEAVADLCPADSCTRNEGMIA